MKEFTLQTEVWLPRPRDEVFAFFADARNLDALKGSKHEFLQALEGSVVVFGGFDQFHGVGCVGIRSASILRYSAHFMMVMEVWRSASTARREGFPWMAERMGKAGGIPG